MAKRKKTDERPPGAPGWMVTYGDLMSLLLTFFVLLLSFATLEERKVKEAISSLKGALGVLPQSRAERTRPDPRPVTIVKPARTEEIKEKVKKLRKELRNRGMESQVRVGQRDKGILNITLSSSLLFRSGSAELLESAYPALEEVADLLRLHMEDYDSDVRVEGHTDDVPISERLAQIFPSNWELSTARAMSVMRFLTAYKPLRRPVSLEENRKHNRRVEIVAIPTRNVSTVPDDGSVGISGPDHQPMPRDDLPEPI